jgi:fatty acid desaturase
MNISKCARGCGSGNIYCTELTHLDFMFRYSADRIPVSIVLLFSLLDFTVYFMVDGFWWLLGYTLLMILPKGVICSWHHHHQHTLTFHWGWLNRLLEFFYALHTGVTSNLWVLHHVLGHHKNFLDQGKDESAWMGRAGKTMGPLKYTFVVAATAYYRGFKVGQGHPKAQRIFLLYSVLTVIGVALLLWYRPIPALMVFVVPMIISLLFTVWVTYDHHSGLDTDNQFEGSYNNISPLFNLLTGNLGYHTAHHYKQGAHWSVLPELHETIKDQIPQHLMRNANFVIAD